MDDPIFKTKYQKYKTKVKLWEKNFKQIHGRVPSKHDIREAPSAIRDSYKMYYKLKTSFLEEALSDAFDEDSFDLSILENSSQNESRLSGSFTELSTPDVSALTNENSIILQNSTIETFHTHTNGNNSHRKISGSQFGSDQREFEAEVKSQVNENAWARDTSNGSINTSLNSSNSKLRKSMSDKLFRNSSFLKRNPRKSLSRNSFNNSQSSQSQLSSASQRESLPDLETILSQKSKQQKDDEENAEQQPTPVPDPKSLMAKNVINNIDVEWLNRCNTANSIGSDATVPLTKPSDSLSQTPTQPKVFGLSNINATALANYESSQPVAAAAAAAAASAAAASAAVEVGAKSMLSFDMSSLNLRSQNSFVGNGGSFSGGGHGAVAPNPVDDDDNEVANSEDESEMNTSRQIRSIRHSNKRKHNEIDTEVPTNKLPKNASDSGTNNTNNNSKIVQDKHQVAATNGSTSHAKPKLEVKAKAKTKATSKTNDKIEKKEDVAVPVVARKSSRNINKPMTYEQTIPNDLKSDDEEEEADPFAGDDSDNDPNFSISPKTRKGANAMNCSSPDSSDNEEQTTTGSTTRTTTTTTTTKEEAKAKTKAKPKTDTKRKVIKKNVESTVKTRQRVVRTKSEVKPIRTKVIRKASVRTKKEPNTNHDKSLDENEPQEETPDDYLLEFGMENIKSVPRMPVTELQKNTMEFTKYAYSAAATEENSTKSSTVAATSGAKPTSSKNAVAKDKLQQKIAAGSLNENYVRLNLRKKVFVRGKKTMNFSRYKKKLWKSQKAAALSGPEMDMRGCDGGILTCFQCGMPGHFAQNCKIKSDRLLPLTAEEESPFPTLQEVEEMSNQQIKLAHWNRALPQSDNPVWKSQATENEETLDSVEMDEMIDESEAAESEATQSESTTENQSQAAVATPSYIGHQIPEDFLIKAGLIGNDADDDTQVKALYKLNSDGSVRKTPAEVYEALALFGHKEFRSGQEKAVMRILSGQSTLVTLSTGSGKSLCYQLPAYMYSRQKRCITLVISPLVSLMDDQVQGVPHFLNAQCLHANLSAQKRAATLELIKAGKVDVLLISPEAVVSAEKTTGFGSILRDLPPVAFVCIDECHCVSQFGHNFRPSYLMVCRVLYENLKIKTVLGLTATATISTRLSIVEHLRIPDGLDGVISDIPLPDNLTLTIASDDNRDLALIQLLKEPRFVEYQSIIIYCSRRDECERVAKNLRTYFQDNIARELEQRNSSGKRKRTLKTTIEPYHAGMAGSRRRTIQNAFMRGDLKIVVATIAFGMGINKADIRCVIHYNMPMNFESYVQEVGRAGRDGKPAHCHLFLDSRGEDQVELRRHIFANSIDRHTIRKLLRKIFIPCACKKPEQPAIESKHESTVEADLAAAQQIDWNDEMAEDPSSNTPKSRNCPKHEICFSVDETINELDIPEENIATLLCYLELHDQRYVKALSKAYIRCKVLSYGGSKALKNAALKCPPLAMAIALDIRKGISHDTSTFIEFPVIEIASAIGWNSGVVKYQLKQLEWTTENGTSKRSNISVEFFDLGFRVLAPGDLTESELDSTLDMLYSRVKEQENNRIGQLENVFRGLSSVAVKSSLACAAVDPKDERSERLKQIVRKYFQTNEKINYVNDVTDQATEPAPDPAMDQIIISDVYTMISRYPENNFTGRNLARIFHGVQSPVFPAVIWGRCKYWRAHLKTDFNHIVKLANAVILKLRT